MGSGEGMLALVTRLKSLISALFPSATVITVLNVDQSAGDRAACQVFGSHAKYTVTVEQICLTCRIQGYTSQRRSYSACATAHSAASLQRRTLNVALCVVLP